MSNERFTQGEWIANGAFVEDEYGVEIVSGVFYAPEPELMANAHLISAAPDMYRALSVFINNSSIQTNFPHECEIAEAVLAKADGEVENQEGGEVLFAAMDYADKNARGEV